MIADVKDPTVATAAVARLGQLALGFADALYTTEVPVAIRTDESAYEACCDALTAVAEPLDQRAVDGFTACLQVSTALGWSSTWSPLCERELGRLRPDQFPVAAELRATPASPSPPREVERAVLDVP